MTIQEEKPCYKFKLQRKTFRKVKAALNNIT